MSWIENKERIATNFMLYAKFGDIKSLGKFMSSKNFDKWMKESGVIDNNILKSNDTDIAFTKILGKKPKLIEFFRGSFSHKAIEFNDLKQIIDDLSAHISKEIGKKNLNSTPEESQKIKDEAIEGIINKLSNCKPPQCNNLHIIRNDVVSRLTDTSKFTGTQKEKFGHRDMKNRLGSKGIPSHERHLNGKLEDAKAK